MSPTQGAGRDEDPLVGRTLVDRYQIERKLGEGGMGSVYLARHTTLDKEVALKVLHGEFSRKQDLVDRFLQEAQAASKIRHENVIDITDFGKTEGYVFFAMELLEGRDLHEELARAKLDDRVLPWPRTRKIFLQVCAALEAVHGQGIVHRDLKPENIYLVEWYGHQDFVKLLDFGIAKVTEVSGQDGRRLTKTGMLFGTPEYMSPEQARGEQADHRSDIYAMGCILYQMLLGQVPYDAENFMGILTKHLAEEVPGMTKGLHRSGAPAAIEGIILRSLTKKPEERYQSIKEFADAVRSVRDNAVPQAMERTPSGGRKRTQWTGSVKSLGELEGEVDTTERPRQRRPGVLIGAAVLLATVVGGGAFMATRSAAAPEAKAPAETAPLAPPPSAGVVTEAQDATVVVTIDSIPQGAAVVDDHGNTVGTTPYETTAPVGSAPESFQLRLQGYTHQSLSVGFAETKRFSATLVKKPSSSTTRRRPDKGSSHDDKENVADAKRTADSTTETAPGTTNDATKTPPEKDSPQSLKCDPKVNKDCERLKTDFPGG